MSFTLFRGVTAFLESLENQLQRDERLTAENLRDLADVCEGKLLAAFPDLIPWRMEWDRRGVAIEEPLCLAISRSAASRPTKAQAAPKAAA